MTFSRRDFLVRSTGYVTVSAMVPRWAVKGAHHGNVAVTTSLTGRPVFTHRV